jgi:uncharacterized protein YqeY
MLIDDIKKRITAAMKSGDTLARDVLRLAQSEIQTNEARKAASGGEAFSEEESVAVVRKLIKSNEETLALAAEGARATDLRREIEVLTELLPARLGPAQIVEILASQHEAIKAAKSDGQATGVAMKHIKSVGASVDGKDVASAVKTIRGG